MFCHLGDKMCGGYKTCKQCIKFDVLSPCRGDKTCRNRAYLYASKTEPSSTHWTYRHKPSKSVFCPRKPAFLQQTEKIKTKLQIGDWVLKYPVNFMFSQQSVSDGYRKHRQLSQLAWRLYAASFVSFSADVSTQHPCPTSERRCVRHRLERTLVTDLLPVTNKTKGRCLRWIIKCTLFLVDILDLQLLFSSLLFVGFKFILEASSRSLSWQRENGTLIIIFSL